MSLGFTLGMSLPQVAIAQPDILVIIGKDNYLFPAWGTTDEPNWPAIDATVARVAEVHKRLAARGIALVAPVLPSKKLFYADKLPAVDALTPEMLGRYAGIRDRLAAAGVPGFDVERLYRALQANGEPVYYRTDQHWTQSAADATAQATADLIHHLVPKLAGATGTGSRWAQYPRNGGMATLQSAFSRQSNGAPLGVRFLRYAAKPRRRACLMRPSPLFT